MEHRFSTYETISAKACPIYIKLKFQQVKRRQETLEIQKQKRDQQINERRNIKNDTDNTFMEIDERKNGTVVPSNEAYELATSMMYSEWMLETPEDIDSWIAVLCPEGKRCCVIAQDNKTKTVNKFGTTLNNFPSLFPYGCRVSNNCPSHRKRTVLDCVYSFKLKKYYVLDIIEWMGVPYTDFDAEFRFYFIQSKLSEIPGINEKSTTNFYPFELAPRMVTRDLYQHLLEKCQFFPDNIELDGINFYYPQSLYTSGETPLVLWLKPFMIPDVLQKPVNDQLAQLHRPPHYVNVFEYSQSLKKKNRKFKKKKNSISNNDKMDVENLVEVEMDKDPVVENEICMEN
ncbi:snurportin-1-like isoform X2 [Rhopalosiphum padi]|uniref:snurportin-1-like isoform X2 n=1 Tax=Rhopalosiphum padi TaxID=40932 RepID=UPI00298E4E13|nr:snurportin-1-like isoform X2 [Rhopalosiphum padi]XP_060835187.1 snurportin-1-like isoform X2 [Rhopalosiphum padi]XP_060835188.1 snurportin-1-like isoform X2 [Rhopalosiphum padi]